MQNLPNSLRYTYISDLKIEDLAVGMVCEVQFDGFQNCGKAIYGGLSEDGQPRWWVEGYSLRQYNERDPPEIDWKKSPASAWPEARHRYLKIMPIDNFEKFVKKQMPPGVRQVMETMLGQKTFEEKPHVCDNCQRKYVYKGDLDRHVASGVCSSPAPSIRSPSASIQVDGPPFKCGTCSKVYVRAGDLRNHLASRSCENSAKRSVSMVEPEAHFKCEHCLKSLPSQRQLLEHVQVCELSTVGRIPDFDPAVPVFGTQIPRHWGRDFAERMVRLHEVEEQPREVHQNDVVVDGERTDEVDTCLRPRKKRVVADLNLECKHCYRTFKQQASFHKHQASCAKLSEERSIRTESKMKERAEQNKSREPPKPGPTVATPAPTSEQSIRKARYGLLNSKALLLPEESARIVTRSWLPHDAVAGFTWPELSDIGDDVIANGSSFLRVHYTMRHGNSLAKEGIAWAGDTESVIVADGALYLRDGELWVHYQDPDYCTREHLDATEDCCILKVDELSCTGHPIEAVTTKE